VSLDIHTAIRCSEVRCCRYRVEGGDTNILSLNYIYNCGELRQGGVLAMTRELAMVHAREGIRVNSLCP